MIIGRRPPTVFEEKGSKSDGADNIILGGTTTPSFGYVKGFLQEKKSNLHKVAQALAVFFRKGQKK